MNKSQSVQVDSSIDGQPSVNALELKERLFQLLQETDVGSSLQEILELIRNTTFATAVYMGVFEDIPKEEEGETEGEEGKQVRYTHATEKNYFMVGQVLKQGQGVTFDALEPQETEEETLIFPPVFIENVLREERIHFFGTPRLGSYAAFGFEFDSCLHADAFPEDLDMQQVARAFDFLDKKESGEIKESKESKEEKEDAENGEKEDKEEDPALPEPNMKKVRMVLCVDTLDGELGLNDEDLSFLKEVVGILSRGLTRSEKQALYADLRKKLVSKDDSAEINALQEEEKSM